MNISTIISHKPYPTHQKSAGIESIFLQQSAKFHQTSWTHYQPLWTDNEASIRELPKLLKKVTGIKSWYWKQQNQRLQNICAKHEKVFTIVQHDNGVVVSKHITPPKNLIVFSSGGQGDIPLPLFCDPRPTKDIKKRDLLVSFKGMITHNSHHYPFREVIPEAFTDSADCIFIDTNKSSPKQTEDYIDLMRRSRFALCPRGYGRTSFRLIEALQQGAIPIYIHDGTPWLPYVDKVDWNEFAIIVNYQELRNFEDILREIPEDVVKKMMGKGKDFLEHYMNPDYAVSYVADKLNQWESLSIPEIKTKCAQLVAKAKNTSHASILRKGAQASNSSP